MFWGFFNKSNTILNERDINLNGKTIRPDRLEINTDKEVWLLDYKTGSKNDSHKDQIDVYAKALTTMGYTIRKKIIVYLNEEEQIYIP